MINFSKEKGSHVKMCEPDVFGLLSLKGFFTKERAGPSLGEARW